MKMGEIYTLDHETDLFILSACHTATGKVFSGEGVQGITKAFLKKGQSQVVSSLWAASEVPTLNIIKGMLTSLKNHNNIGAIHALS